jgi:hypothetical protein
MNRRTFLQSIPIAALFSSFFMKGKSAAVALSSNPDELICRNKFDFAVSLKLPDRPINEIIVEIAKSFIGVDYAAGTLEAPGEEQLLINLQTLDCVTFFENSLVLARCIKKGLMTFEDYKKELQFVRYRGGIIDKYPSRLHYTSDYFFDNEKKGVLENITMRLGGIRYKKKIDFMSTHANSYLQLRDNPEFVKTIAEQESEINKRTIYHIPKTKVRKLASGIKDGDILGITTTIKGLDCTHTGIAVRQKRELHMIHAPVPGSKVQISDMPLWEYLMKIKKDAGIMVVRALEPKM